MRVLLADDNHDIIEDVKYILRHVFGEGLELILCHTGEELRELVSVNTYDLVFTDNDFRTNITGSEAIKATGYAGPVVLFTADSIVVSAKNIIVVDKTASDDEIASAIKSVMS